MKRLASRDGHSKTYRTHHALGSGVNPMPDGLENHRGRVFGPPFNQREVVWESSAWRGRGIGRDVDI